MMRELCFVLFSVILSVSCNPLGQLIPSCNVCQPSSYTNPAVVIQPSNTNPCAQSGSVQIPTSFAAPLGDTLNQIILSRVLTNPSLQKIIDPNTRLFNQNGDEVNRQVSNAGTPNVINNYFIVPPEFFNLTETNVKEAEEVKVDVQKPRRKNKRKEKIDSDIFIDTKTKATPVHRRKQKGTSSLLRNNSRVSNGKRVAIVDELDQSEEVHTRKERERNKRRHKNDKNEQTITPPPEDSDEYLENVPVVNTAKKNKISKNKNIKRKPKPIVDYEESVEIVTEVPSSKTIKNQTPLIEKLETNDKQSKVRKTKKQQPADLVEQLKDDKILKNIELPTDSPGHTSPENRKARGFNRKVAKKEPEPRNTGSRKKAPSQRITPFPDDVVNQFFPYMGNYYNPVANYPHNLDQYYQYFNPNGYPKASRNKKSHKNQNKKKNKLNSSTHNIEVKLKPNKQENENETTTTPTNTEFLEGVEEVTVSSEAETTTESFERVTELPMEVPTKVTPVQRGNKESASEESYETFNKLDKLHEHITPALGKEDEVPVMNSNGITRDYYPVFYDDVYYSPHIENQNLEDEDDSFLYESVIEDELKRDRRKYDRYEDSRYHSGLENPGFTTKQLKNEEDKINKFNYNEYPKNIVNFFDTGPDNKNSDEEIKPEIRRVKVPSKNTRIPAANIETVFSGSKVAKYGIPDGKVAAYSSNINQSNENDDSTDKPVYVIAKSVGRLEDYI